MTVVALVTAGPAAGRVLAVAPRVSPVRAAVLRLAAGLVPERPGVSPHAAARQAGVRPVVAGLTPAGELILAGRVVAQLLALAPRMARERARVVAAPRRVARAARLVRQAA